MLPGRGGIALRMAAPYLAVGIFWCGFHDGWATILAYHAQILGWSRGRWAGLVPPRRAASAWFILPAAFTGPLLYVLLPVVARVDLTRWLTDHHLSGWGLAAMVAYLGLVHPPLEQVHWAPLRERTHFAHIAFAAYHLLVLESLLGRAWLPVLFLVLVVSSFAWQRMTRDAGSLVPAVASHTAADVGALLAAWFRHHG